MKIARGGDAKAFWQQEGQMTEALEAAEQVEAEPEDMMEMLHEEVRVRKSEARRQKMAGRPAGKGRMTSCEGGLACNRRAAVRRLHATGGFGEDLLDPSGLQGHRKSAFGVRPLAAQVQGPMALSHSMKPRCRCSVWRGPASWRAWTPPPR